MQPRLSLEAVLCVLALVSCGGSTSSPSGTGGGSGGAEAGVGPGGSGGATASGGRASGGIPNGTGGVSSVAEAGIARDSATSDSGASDAAVDGAIGCPPADGDAGPPACIPDNLFTTLNACGATRANASRVVAGMRAGFRNCYNQALSQDPGVYGMLTIFIDVAPDGSITGVTSKAEGNLPDSVAACMRARASAAQFDAGTGPTTFVVSLLAGCGPTGDAMP